MTDNLDDLQQRIRQLKQDTQPHAATESADEESVNEKRDIGAAYELIMTPVICGGLGAGLDKLLSTSPTFFIILAILGVLAGFWRIYRVSQNIQTPLDLKRLQDAKKQGRKTQISDEDDD